MFNFIVISAGNSIKPVFLCELQFLKHHQQNNRKYFMGLYVIRQAHSVPTTPPPNNNNPPLPQPRTPYFSPSIPACTPLTHRWTYPLPPRVDLVCAAHSPATWKRNDLMERKRNRCVPLQITEGLFLLLMVGAQTNCGSQSVHWNWTLRGKCWMRLHSLWYAALTRLRTFQSLSLLLPPDALSPPVVADSSNYLPTGICLCVSAHVVHLFTSFGVRKLIFHFSYTNIFP